MAWRSYDESYDVEGATEAPFYKFLQLGLLSSDFIKHRIGVNMLYLHHCTQEQIKTEITQQVTHILIAQ